ncbi:hypothetical protein [Henriciella litoralis]|uniref:hypothetical protein n=1 Tax=Henriciella litoralis TaxID=568102 RepID=UPI00111C8888|nr:hypothetical protein [Henriciella litoralis]
MTSRPVFRTLSVIVATFVAITGCAPAMGVAQEPPVDADQASDSGADTVYLPEGFPETINFPQGTTLRSATGGMPPDYASRSYLIEGQAGMSKADMASFFQAMLEKKGFEILSIEEGYATVIMFAAPGLDDGSVQIVDGFDSDTSAIFTLSLIMEAEPE